MNQPLNTTEPWVCFSSREDDYDGYYYLLVGNKAGLRAMGETLIALSNSENTSLSEEDIELKAAVKKHHIAIDEVVVVDASFQEFDEVEKQLAAESKPKNKGNYLPVVLAVFAVILFLIGAGSGFVILLQMIFGQE